MVVVVVWSIGSLDGKEVSMSNINSRKAAIIIMIVILFLSFFVFPFIERGYDHEWRHRRIQALILSGTFILLWGAVLLAAVKMKSKLLMRAYEYYWLAIVGSCFLVILTIEFQIYFLSIVAFFLAVFLIMPIYGAGSLLVMTGLVLPSDNLMLFYLLISLTAYIVGVFVNRNFSFS